MTLRFFRFTRRALPALVLVCALIFGNAQAAFASGNASDSLLIRDADRFKLVMIGDSYGTNPRGTEHWDDAVRAYFGLKTTETLVRTVGGSGFTRKREKLSFVAQLEKLPSDSAVRLVLVVGGVRNDLGASTKRLRKKMKEFKRIARKKYPNAVICYAAPNYNVKKKPRVKMALKRQKILKRKKVIRSICKKLGWIYLKKTERCLYGSRKNFLKDRHHPSARGQKILSETILSDLRKAGFGEDYFEVYASPKENPEDVISGLSEFLKEDDSGDSSGDEVETGEELKAGAEPDRDIESGAA